MAANPDVRWRQRLQSFRKAFGQLSKAAAIARQRELSELERQGFIKAFEFTHELAWNTLQDFLELSSTFGFRISQPASFRRPSHFQHLRIIWIRVLGRQRPDHFHTLSVGQHFRNTQNERSALA